MEVDEGSERNSDIQPQWMTAYARLKNAFTEDEKYHNLMRWLKRDVKEVPVIGCGTEEHTHGNTHRINTKVNDKRY